MASGFFLFLFLHLLLNVIRILSRSYGPQGEFIIFSSLMRVFAENDEEHKLEDMLFSTLHTVITTDDEHFRDYDENAASSYLTVKDFTRFVLVPFVAASLILEDLPGLENIQDATFERDNSNEFGEFFHADQDDPGVDNIHRRNTMAIRNIERDRKREQGDGNEAVETAPPRHRRAIVKTEPAPPSLKVSDISLGTLILL